MKKYFIIIFLVIISSIYAYAFSGGIFGTTRKNGNGCVCHNITASPEVHVTINGPDTMLVNDSAEFFVKLAGGPLIRGGTNIASRKGILVPGIGLRMSNDELTHSSPFTPQNDTVTFAFKYKAPSASGDDTMYANGNSVNFDGFSIGDKWNFAPDKKIVIVNSTNIINFNTPSGNYSLNQNFPNPFNPNTFISYQLAVSSIASLKIYDVLGNEVATLVDQKQNAGSYSVKFDGSDFPSGVYFYRLAIHSDKLIAGDFSKTNKMILIK